MIYLDNAATTYPKPASVAQAMSVCLSEHGANPGRAAHRMALRAESEILTARREIAAFFTLGDPNRVIFTHNCTDALNFAIKGVLNPGDHVVTSATAHNSVSRPLEAMKDRGLITLTRVPTGRDGLLDPALFLSAVTEATRLVEVTHGSNVTGAVQPLEAIAKGLRAFPKARLLVDAAQTGGILPIEMAALGIDLLALPGHKGLFGPPGTGLLLVSERSVLRPWREGGTGGDSAARLQPTELPFHWESGTPNTVGIAGLLAGLREVRAWGLERIYAHERELMTALLDDLKDDARFTLYGPQDTTRQVGVFSFNIRGWRPQEVGAALDASGDIAVRAGLHCAPYIHQAVGSFAQGGTVRISLSYMNTLAEIETTIKALKAIAG